MVVHDIPGRLRFRAPAGLDADAVQRAVGAVPGVGACAWSPRTRSLLVLYDPAQTDRQAVVDAVAHTVGNAIADAHPTIAVTAVEPGGTLALGVRQLFGELDQRVQRASRGLVGLGGLLPVALTAWALTEVVRGRVGPLAWSSALWYAHGL